MPEPDHLRDAATAISRRRLKRREFLRNGAAFAAAGLAGAYAPAAIGQAWKNVFENMDISTPAALDGSGWDNTLVRNCRFHDVSGNGLTLRSVTTVRIENCIFENIDEDAIHLSVTGDGTTGVTLIGNMIRNCGKHGITAPQRYQNGLDQKNLRILSNRIENVGLSTDGGSGLLHGIYVQAQEFLIEGNSVLNAADGNGISVRSSGIVRGNTVDGTAKSGIAYYADHMRGHSQKLIIERNAVRNAGRDSARCAIDLLEIPDSRLAVRNFVIRDNDVASACDIEINPAYGSRRYSVVLA